MQSTKRMLMHSFSSESTQVFMCMAPRVMNIALLWVGVWSGWKGKHLCICESVCHALLCVTYKEKVQSGIGLKSVCACACTGWDKKLPFKCLKSQLTDFTALHGPVHLSAEHSACLRVFGHADMQTLFTECVSYSRHSVWATRCLSVHFMSTSLVEMTFKSNTWQTVDANKMNFLIKKQDQW